ncbi:diguanylate cyclase response regulator [Halorhodospira abdelmalekii]|uniref:diguanylate cyclase n=1 Tax=Halorhodospira abdelmalekii TaxID=421629 RepID=UPI0019079B80|nr:diguanylate cyclase [Halorhodospira abdelmalekii]MBK1734648.1 diguanylate cyclase response regulator [Halorhodospira abdelmalekii]
MDNTSGKATILVVDDEPANIQALGALLKGEYRIQIANSGKKALAMVQNASQPPPDLILLDIQMPDIDGYEICRRLKEDPATTGIAIIFVTALDAASDEEHGLNLGAVDYIAKPFNPAIVRARVRTHMSLKRKTDLLEQYALLDGLTGIPNRRYFDEQVQSEVRRSVREGSPLSLVMLDIDHFKLFNDHYGHGAGDLCLQKVARALSGALLRPGDRVCRYGGEEFVALLPATDAAGARVVAEQLRAAVEALAIDHEYSSTGPVVSISLGIATIDLNTPSPALLLQQADEALYRAKVAGRNRVGG